ncbi:hypothetical protein E6C50_01430 [Flavobacterium supellecticarium]|uniref:Uncharacterized protein n=1 Tax=Flavobacterium supellecticarium TaxID=2565924 RepID=A0A4V3W8W8_9FLAO|nr:hypothetical protein [Flavobacterium supellecticarium]THF52896.1 hypothetical protein E6C50_01430 [Flavobacterium supellecticarium]
MSKHKQNPSLETFKKMALNTQSDVVLKHINGGLENLWDCHGIWGKVGKTAREWGEFLDKHPKL